MSWHSSLCKNLQVPIVPKILYFRDFATDSNETLHIYEIRHDESSGKAVICFQWKKNQKSVTSVKMSITHD